MTPRHIAMGAALLLAAGLVFFGDNTPEPEVAEAVERAPAPAATTVVSVAAPKTGARPEPAILGLVPRAELIGDDDDVLGKGADVFGSQNWQPPPPKPIPPPPPPPPPPPTAPPLPFVYMGKAVSAGSWEVFLSRGDQIHIVKDNTVIDNVYRVDKIAPPLLTFTYLPLNQVQQLNIGVLD